MTEAGNLALWNLNVLGELDLQFSGQATPVIDALLTFDGANWRPIVPVISNTASYISIAVDNLMALSGMTINIEDNVDLFCKDLGNVNSLEVDSIMAKDGMTLTIKNDVDLFCQDLSNVKSLVVDTLTAKDGTTITIQNDVDLFCQDLANVKSMHVDLISPKTPGGNITLDGNVDVGETLYVSTIAGKSPVTVKDALTVQGNLTLENGTTFSAEVPTDGDVMTYSGGLWVPAAGGLSLVGHEILVLHQNWETTLQTDAPQSASVGVRTGAIRWTNTLVVPAMYDPQGLFSGAYRQTIDLDTTKMYRIHCTVSLGPSLTGGNPDPGAWKGRLYIETPLANFIGTSHFVTGEYVTEGTSIQTTWQTILFPAGTMNGYPESDSFQIFIESGYGNVSLGGQNQDNPPTINDGSGALTIWEIIQ